MRFARFSRSRWRTANVTEREQFPNCGLVWWMLVGIEHRFAQPGRLVSFALEPAPEFSRDAPEKHQYQVRRGSIRPVRPPKLSRS